MKQFRSIYLSLLVGLIGTVVHAQTTPTWTHSTYYNEVLVGNWEADTPAVINPTPELVVPSMLDNKPVKQLGYNIVFGCNDVKSLTVPETICVMYPNAFRGYSGKIVFEGFPPHRFEESDCGWRTNIVFPETLRAVWEEAMRKSRLASGPDSKAEIKISAVMSGADEMTITYRVISYLPKVHVRLCAFRSGIESLDNLVEVKSGTDVPGGEPVVTNTDHTVVWKMGLDGITKPDRYALCLLVKETLDLSEQLYVIPATDSRPIRTVWDARLQKALAFRSLLWNYLNGDPSLQLRDGLLSGNGQSLIRGKDVLPDAVVYFYRKAGYRVLQGQELDEVCEFLHLPLAKTGLERAAVKDGDCL